MLRNVQVNDYNLGYCINKTGVKKNGFQLDIKAIMSEKSK